MKILYPRSMFLFSVLVGATLFSNVVHARAASIVYSQPDVAFPSVAPERLKPVAGRNRRRPMAHPALLYPRASMDQLSVSAGTQKLRINVLANDSGRNLRLRAVNPRSAKGGRVYLKNNRVIYMPPSGYLGKDSFWYTVVDRGGNKHSAKVVVCVCDN